MFFLYDRWDFARHATFEDYEKIFSPGEGFRLATMYYELDYQKYPEGMSVNVPQRKWNIDEYFSDEYIRSSPGTYDELYDDVNMQLKLGWLIAVDRNRHWSWNRNPFYFDENGNLVYQPFMPEVFADRFKDEIFSAYRETLSRNQGRKPSKTQKPEYESPTYIVSERHSQTTTKLNNKHIGQLLAAGGIYNNNIVDFRKTAEQLGKETLAGYDGIMTETNIGIGIAAASLLFVKNPATTEGLLGFLGKTKSTKVFMDNVTMEQITYVRRPRDEYISLRKQFDNSVRKNFLQGLSKVPSLTHYFTATEIETMAKGKVPDLWQVHHKLPLDDSGDNSFDNLVLIKLDPYHRVLTHTQKTITTQLKTCDRVDTLWPLPNGMIYNK